MRDSYWSTLVEKRLKRRRMLAGVGGAALGAALLAACGGGNDDGEEVSGLVKKAVDSTKQAKQGGILKTSRPTDVQTFHPFQISSPTAWHASHVYSRLLRAKPGYMQPYRGEVEPDFAESYELSGDKQTITFKLRANAKLDPRSPTNGRNLAADDVVFSWKMYESIASRRADIANSVNPAAPIISMTAPDQQTVVVKMAFPDSSIFVPLATGGERFQILPKEAEGGFDPKTEMRGSGPFYLSDYNPSSSFTYKRNPGYWEQGRPYIDGMDVPILPEYAAALAQFRTGAIWLYDDSGAGSLVRAEDIFQTKRDVPDISLYESNLSAPTSRGWYGFTGGMAQSPLIDERIRQAFSLSMDRNLWIDTFFNVPALEAEGIPVTKRWTTAINASHEGWWLDPEGKDFGENAKYYKLDIAEAKKLQAAAGFANGAEFASHHIVTADYGRDTPKYIEVMIGMAAESGMKIRIEPSDFRGDFRERFANSKGNHDGMCFANLTAGEVGNWIAAVYSSTGSLFKGFSSSTTRAAGDPYIDDLAIKVNREFDQEKRYALAHDLQRYEAKTQYMFPMPGGASGVILSWPVVQNRFVFDGAVEELYLWLDTQKKPVGTA